jgi:hypothetical protein
MFIYADNRQPFSGSINVWNWDGTKKFLEHYDNYLLLHLFATEGTRAERAQAEKEIAICERKMRFWRRHPKFDSDVAQKEIETRVQQWKGRLAKIPRAGL